MNQQINNNDTETARLGAAGALLSLGVTGVIYELNKYILDYTTLIYELNKQNVNIGLERSKKDDAFYDKIIDVLTSIDNRLNKLESKK